MDNLTDSTDYVGGLGRLTPESVRGLSKSDLAGYTKAGELISQREKEAKSERAGRTEAEFYKQFGGALTQPYETFKPSQETGSGYAALGMLMMVAGGLMGGKGKLSGIGAMNNIAGMMDGYRSGRKDLYENERQMFEENFKIQQQNRALIKEAFDQALKVAKYDLSGAKQMLVTRLKSLGASIPAEYVSKNGVIPGAQMMAQADANHTKMLNSISAKLKPQDLLAIEAARRSASSAEQLADIELKTKQATLAKTEAEVARGGLTAVEVKAETDRQELAKALHEDFVRTKQEPVIKDEKLLGAYKKLFPDAPYRVSDKQTTESDVMSDAAVKSRVDRFLAGDRTATTGFGLSALGQKNRNKFEDFLAQEMSARGMTGKDIALKLAEYDGIKAEERTLGTRTAYIELASQELNQLIPTLEKASSDVPRGSFMPITQLMQKAETSLSDPRLIKLRTAINGVQQAYVRALTPTGTPTDMLRRKADDLFGPAVDNEGIKAALEQMQIEVNAALQAPDAVRASIQRRYGGGGTTTTTTAAPSVAGATTLPPEAVAKLKEGVKTTFSNGQTWTLKNGVPTKVE